MYNVVYKVMYLFMFFFIASMIGYIAEVTCCSIKDKKLVWNRGFLIGPYIPMSRMYSNINPIKKIFF